MSNIQAAALILSAMLVLIALRVPIGAAMFVSGAHRLLGPGQRKALLSYLKGLLWARFSVYDLSVIPLFLLMGQFASAAGFSRTLFRAAEALMGHRKGGVAMSAIVACACVRRDLRLVGGDRRHHVAGRAAGNEAAEIFRPPGDRNTRGRRRAGNPHSAVGHLDHLCAARRAEHRKTVRRGFHPRHPGRGRIHGGDRHLCAALSRVTPAPDRALRATSGCRQSARRGRSPPFSSSC